MIGCYSRVVTPVPIPNTEVKHTCADGTAWATVWKSRSQPIILLPFFYCIKKGAARYEQLLFSFLSIFFNAVLCAYLFQHDGHPIQNRN